MLNRALMRLRRLHLIAQCLSQLFDALSIAYSSKTPTEADIEHLDALLRELHAGGALPEHAKNLVEHMLIHMADQMRLWGANVDLWMFPLERCEFTLMRHACMRCTLLLSERW